MVKTFGREMWPCRGRLQRGGREGLVWWREIVNIRDGVGSVGGAWFPDHVRLQLGREAKTLFWVYRWVGKVPFQVCFRRLFDLSENKW